MKISDNIVAVKGYEPTRWELHNLRCSICGHRLDTIPVALGTPIMYTWEGKVVVIMHRHCVADFQKILIQNQENTVNISVLLDIKSKMEELTKKYG